LYIIKSAVVRIEARVSKFTIRQTETKYHSLVIRSAKGSKMNYDYQ
jgi:hypothetical protein